MDTKIIKVAATLQKKKTTINRAKVKKTIKNTLCRPDPVFWPSITEENAKLLETALSKHKVDIPEYNKLHWKVLKSIPKEERPKQPKTPKVNGLIFGLNQCTEVLNAKQCSAIIIESTVNPRTIVQPLIEACISCQVPVVCLTSLKKITSVNFGIPTSCLAVKNGFLQDLRNQIEELAKMHKTPQPQKEKDSENEKLKIVKSQEIMEIDNNIKQEIINIPTSFTYLYRTSKNKRVFNPSLEEPKEKKVFIGQDFIEFTQKPEQKSSDNKAFKSMILKKITNCQNRIKRK